MAKGSWTPIYLVPIYQSLLISAFLFASPSHMDHPDDIFEPSFSSQSIGACYENERKICEESQENFSYRFNSGSASTHILTGVNNLRKIMSHPHNTLAIGHAHDGTSLQGAFMKVRLDGALDTTFHTDGKVTHDFTNADDLIHDAKYETNQGSSFYKSIYFAGRGGSGDVQWLVGKIKTTGELDTAFYTAGYRLGTFDAKSEILRGLTKVYVGRLLAGGYLWKDNKYNFAVAAYLSDGVLDTSFNTTGWNWTPIGASDNGALSIALHTASTPILGGTTFSADWDFAATRYKTDGTLDTSFNTDGIFSTSVLSADDKAYSIAFDNHSPNATYLGGYAHDGAKNRFAIVKLTALGSLETSFNTTGMVTTAFFGQDAVVFGLVTEPANRQVFRKVTAVGSADNAGDIDIALARYDTDGTLDTSFHTDGKNTFDFGGQNDRGLSIICSSDTATINVGALVTNSGSQDFAILRLETDGTLARSSDPVRSFGERGDGSYYHNINGTDTGTSLMGFADYIGEYTVGYTSSDIFVAKYRAGLLSTTFHTDGIWTIDSGATDESWASQLSASGSYLVGNNGADFLVVRTNSLDVATPTLNSSFNTNGIAAIDFSGNDEAYGVNGSYVVGKDGSTPSNFAIASVVIPGPLDTSFNTNGKKTYSPTGNAAVLKYVFYHSTHNIRYFAGEDTQDLIVMRLLTDGGMSTAFSTSGYMAIDFGGTESFGGAAMGPFQPLLLVGGNGNDFVLARIRPTGGYDTSFNTNGRLTIDFGTVGEKAKAVFYGTDGEQIVVAGDDGTNFLLSRLLNSGNLDTSFYTTGRRAYSHTGASTMNGAIQSPSGDICVTGSTNGNVDAITFCVNP